MSRVAIAAAVAGLLVAVAAARAFAQDGGPKVGDMAPDFSLKGASRDGLRSTPVHLADLRGQVVVLAFFPQARTKG
jgi:thioredoxin-dependent peroxiredoxin